MEFSEIASRFPADPALPAAESLYRRVLHQTPSTVLVVAESPLLAASVAAAMARAGLGKATVIGALPAMDGLAALSNYLVPSAQEGITVALMHAAQTHGQRYDLVVVAQSQGVVETGFRAWLGERLTAPEGWLALELPPNPGADVLGLIARQHPAVRSISRDAHWGWARKAAVGNVAGFGAAVVAPLEDPGDAPHQCNLCGKAVDFFRPFGVMRRPNAKCPHCGALERHRLFWCYVNRFTNLLDGTPKSLLHIAPENIITAKLTAIPNLVYLSADLDSPQAMVRMDLTEIDYPDSQWDVILCSHVLEHIPDDGKAMREMYRVLKPGGWLMVQVPVYGAETYEDFSITTEEGRLEAFGQKDHVRKYGKDIAQRLRAAGFKVKGERPAQMIEPELVERYGLRNQLIFVCTRPPAG